MSRKLRWALVGASDIAESRVLPAIRANGDEALLVRSANAEHGKRWAEKNSVPHAVTGLDEALDRKDIDAVYISSLNTLHCEQTLAAAAAGKHVLAEKPLAMNLDDARKMVDACKKAGVVMATNHHLPANPVHREMKKIVQSGGIGEVRAIRFNHAVKLPPHLVGWRVDAKDEGGVIFDVTVHDAAAIAAILGNQAIEASAIAKNQDNDPSGPEDAVVSTILWDKNILVQTHDSYNNAHLPTSVHILGTDGALLADDCNTGDPAGTLHIFKNKKSNEIVIGERVDLYVQTIAAFRDAVAGTGDVLVSGEDGIRSLAVAIAVAQAVKTAGRVPVAHI